MIKNSFLAASMMSLLLFGSAMAATKKSSHSLSSSQMRGKIESVNSTELTLNSKIRGKSQQETFVVNPQTKTLGSPAAGENATVRYKKENGQKVATMIRAQKAPSTSTSHSTKR